jgi:hypothetical protein
VEGLFADKARTGIPLVMGTAATGVGRRAASTPTSALACTVLARARWRRRASSAPPMAHAQQARLHARQIASTSRSIVEATTAGVSRRSALAVEPLVLRELDGDTAGDNVGANGAADVGGSAGSVKVSASTSPANVVR